MSAPKPLAAAVTALLALFVGAVSATGCNAILGNELDGLDAGAPGEAGGEASASCDVGKKSCAALGCQSVTDPQFGCGGASCDTCVVDHAATTTCFNKGGTSACASATCRAGFDNCDSDPTNGCEAQSSDARTCGGNGACQNCAASGLKFCAPQGGGVFACSNQCSPPNTVCNNGQLCVDLSNDAAHCGGCANDCRASVPLGTPTGADAECKQGVCTYTCPPSAPQECHGRCVGVDVTCSGTCSGTEHLCPGSSNCYAQGDVEHCGTALGCVDCTANAPPNAAAQGCVAAHCVYACKFPFADCNNDLQKPGGNGCEVDSSSTASCGGCQGTMCTTGQVCCQPPSGGFACQIGTKCGTISVADGG